MKRVLIGYDGSAGADEALAELDRMGLPSRLHLVVLCVADVWMPPANSVPSATERLTPSIAKAREHATDLLARERDRAEKVVGELKGRFPEWEIEAAWCADSPAWALLNRAQAWKADLVVVGSAGRSVLERFFLGSVASKVAAEAVCSVHITRPRLADGGPLRLLVAMDGSSDAEAAVQAVSGRVWPADTEIRLITVLDPKMQTFLAYPTVLVERWREAGDTETTNWVERMIQHSAQSLRLKGCAVETEVFDGDPKRVLLEQARDWPADILFLGARGLHHGDRLYLGTFASAIAARAPCSVEIVRS